MSSEEEDDYPVTNNATAQNSIAPESTIRNLEAEQGYSEDEEEDEPINDAGRESRVADRTGGVAAEDVVSCGQLDLSFCVSVIYLGLLNRMMTMKNRHLLVAANPSITTPMQTMMMKTTMMTFRPVAL
jgi:hypothetical protein